MLFIYKAIDASNSAIEGNIDALNVDVAIASLQRRGLVITAIHAADEQSSLFFGIKNVNFGDRIPVKDVVILSRQMATLFEAQVSALRVFRLIGSEVERPALRKVLETIADDLQGGSSISAALAKHPKVFSDFYVNMVKAGEESGKLNETFLYLADYLDRQYEITGKVRSAMIYPAFVILTFIAVMILMLTLVIPKISKLLIDAGQDIPFHTKIVLGISQFFVDYGVFIGIFAILGGFALFKYFRSETGSYVLDTMKIKVPLVKVLFRKLYLSRISDNMNTMLVSGIAMVRALELTSKVVNNKVFEEILNDALEKVKSGSSVSDALSKREEIPGIMIQMIKVGEETGELGNILHTLANFYSREVKNAVDTMIDLIEPAMIILLGLGVGFLLSSVLIPIYNLANAF